MKSRLAVNLWWAERLMLRDGKSFEEMVELTARTGAASIDLNEYLIGFDPHANLRQVHRKKQCVASNGLDVLSCWFYTDLIGAAQTYSIDRGVEFIEEYLAVAAELGARYAVMFNGEPAPGMSVEEGRSLLLRTYERIAPAAEEYGVIVGFEAARAAATFNSPLGALELVRSFGSKYLTVTPDFESWRRPRPGMPTQYAENPEAPQAKPCTLDVFEACLPYAPYTHVKFLEITDDLEEPNYPIRELMSLALADSRDHDFLVEYEGWLPEVHPERDELRETSRAVTLMRRLIGDAMAPAGTGHRS
jgi:hypothetical protein